MSRRSAYSRSSFRSDSFSGPLPDDLYDYAQPPAPRPGRPPKCEAETWSVSDDWPKNVPVTEAEVDLFEAWFGDLFDELFGPCR